MNYLKHFPYDVPRKEQVSAIEFGLKAFLEDDKKFCIIEAGTGVGKSAVGVTVARVLNEHLLKTDEFGSGAYFLTTQKVLQEQYENDFGKPSGVMRSENPVEENGAAAILGRLQCNKYRFAYAPSPKSQTCSYERHYFFKKNTL